MSPREMMKIIYITKDLYFNVLNDFEKSTIMIESS